MKEQFLRIFDNNKGKAFKFTLPFILLGLGNAMVNLTLATLLMYVFDYAAEGEFSLIYRVVTISGIAVVLLFITTPIFAYFGRKNIAVLMGKLRAETFSKTMDLPYTYHKSRHSGDTISRLTNDLTEVETFLKEGFLNFSSLLILGFAAIIYMFVLEYRLAIVFLIFTLVIFKLNQGSARKMKVISDEVQARKSKFTQNLTDIFQGFQVMKSYNLEDHLKEKMEEVNEGVYVKAFERSRQQAKLRILSNLAFTSSFLFIIVFGILFMYLGWMSIGVVVAFTNLQGAINSVLNFLPQFNQSLQSARASLDRVFEMIDEEKEPSVINSRIKESKAQRESRNLTENRNLDRNRIPGYIEFQDVTFSYEKDQIIPVIDDLSFTIEKGKSVALVGESGGGKSTIIKLILGLYSIDQGEIIVGNQSTAEIDIQEIRENIAYVSQNPYLFTGTIGENISYGKENTDEQEIMEAAKKANAHDFIMKLEKGYDTIIGERGLGLSGGQKQRISIARAIIKDSPILLMDEATSALDTESERLIQQSLKEMMKGKTGITIAHRLSTIVDSDEIFVIKGGKLIERGDHKGLLAKKGDYSTLYHTQFSKREREERAG